MIDATGLVVAPGFIDVVWNVPPAYAQVQLLDGVTTTLALWIGTGSRGARRWLDRRGERSIAAIEDAKFLYFRPDGGSIMRTRLYWLAMLVVACDSAPSPHLTVRQTIEGNNAKIVRWYATGQADSLGSLFARDAWQMPPNSPPLVGRDAIVAFWRDVTSAGELTFELQVQDVLAAEGLAAERGTYSVVFEAGPNAPIPSFQDRGNYVVLWRKDTDAVWRIVWDAPVSTVPLPPAR